MPAAPTSLASILTAGQARLITAGIPEDEARIDVDLYARRILGWDRARVLVERTDPAPAGLEPTFSEWLTRRERREPTAYIVGEREFYGRDFHVSPAVLIPRPETEHIVDAALPLLAAAPGAHVADIGTGCGNIAVTLACEATACTVVATDLSGIALDVARQNAVRHGVADRVRCVETSYLNGVTDTFDIIAANPPYVRDKDKRGLSPSVRLEPEVAIFGGADGMRDIEGVLDAVDMRLRPGGWLLMEFGFGQEDDVTAALARRPLLTLERVIADLQGLARTIVARRVS